jgi:predicted phosphodiesterase
MQVAALYDIHGNLPALEAVLREVREANVDQILVGGDVFPGPMCTEALSCLRALDVPVQFIQGNGEREVLAQLTGAPSDVPEQYLAAIRWVAAQLGPDDQRFVSSWPLTRRIAIPPLGNVLFCHATPRNDTEIFTRVTRDDVLAPIFHTLDVPLVVVGHTHMQFDRAIGSVRVVNAGSVGMPFGDTGAFWLLLGPNVELRRTPYDLAAAAERMRGTAYPQVEEWAVRYLLQPPSEQEMLERYSRAELK